MLRSVWTAPSEALREYVLYDLLEGRFVVLLPSRGLHSLLRTTCRVRPMERLSAESVGRYTLPVDGYVHTGIFVLRMSTPCLRVPRERLVSLPISFGAREWTPGKYLFLCVETPGVPRRCVSPFFTGVVHECLICKETFSRSDPPVRLGCSCNVCLHSVCWRMWKREGNCTCPQCRDSIVELPIKVV